ncbi:MAG: deoxyribodipyrimidine photo-lyase [SAR324 cluster bacterium]|uniref:Deoxyribodipyrimidine photo-lyase n=1 Tax=SAR324 cluster bacterium TaxID=2024889 RepID=A0A7X9FTR0_9DELT|nr:deoxyribodipyrimidine photo-lyase [SAR324 cluster bacterium]
MTKKYGKSLFIFRRDLRIDDNSALLRALDDSEAVLPCFIFDPRQIEKHDYLSHPALNFMLQCLHELSEDLARRKGHLYFFYGRVEELVESIVPELNIDAVFFNRDYTSFSRIRDEAIQAVCNEKKVACEIYADSLLQEPEEICKTNGSPYTVFTPFYKKAVSLKVRTPRNCTQANFFTELIPYDSTDSLLRLKSNEVISSSLKGGRIEALKLLDRVSSLGNYENTKDFPALEGTSKLSAHLKFGSISIREAFHRIKKQLGEGSPLIRQLYWRDFFTHIAWNFPHVFQGAFYKKYDALEWSENEAHFQAWCNGLSGFPIVDAGMRELNSTGFMHNRVRMICASFLVKDLHINWRKGERYFARHLIDYDPSLNNGNWQWSASTGCDAQPYFRIFNPWLQQEKFDPDCIYIKKYIPELRPLAPGQIHKLFKNFPEGLQYPKPICEHAEAAAKARSIYAELD